MVFFLFGLVKLIFGLPKSEEYLPEGLPGILKFCEPCIQRKHTLITFTAHNRHLTYFVFHTQPKHLRLFNSLVQQFTRVTPEAAYIMVFNSVSHISISQTSMKQKRTGAASNNTITASTFAFLIEVTKTHKIQIEK